ncbi:hypothetical protein ART_0244 [Arthrobacter sp. PAMC 25486]|uniref:OB-fold nucleic acid binding domain-containing protein n=1 Tax=Arthrobacter sp. PAMC 25486 TaxID=1494608 RepID=UPI000535D9B6|nr:OB-fold nucleic acid binding domain-containing protein [Arthrobacter sp. PAMC 25486]AIX99842.1 hypothetical protein ART_0244 [Arthrobacter sp. PAMC 25486]
MQQGEWPEATAISELPVRGRAVCTGVISAVTILPESAAPSYLVILTDRESERLASDGLNHRLRLVWIGRRRVPGVVAGTRLRVEGMVSLRDGLPTMYNPRYEIIGIQEI